MMKGRLARVEWKGRATLGWFVRGLVTAATLAATLAVILAVIPAAIPAVLAAQEGRGIAIVDATVVPMVSDGPEGSLLAHHTVLVRDGVIEAVGPTADVSIPADYRQVDARGRFVLPGLIDSHYHLYDPDDLPVLLSHGITAVLNQAGAPFHLDLAADIRDGRVVGPTLYTTAPQLKDEAHPAIDTERQVSSEEDARRLTATQAEMGYDFVKPWSGFGAPVYEAIADEAAAREISLLGHIPRSMGLRGIVEHGQSIAHVEEFYNKHFGGTIDDAGIAEAVDIVAEGGVAVSTTLITYEMVARTVSEDMGGLLDRPGRGLLDPVRQIMWEPEFNEYHTDVFLQRGSQHYRDALAFKQRIAKALHDAGVPLMAGTDAGFLPGIVPGEDLHRELELLVDAGLSPTEAIGTATREPGRFLSDHSRQEGTVFGTIEVGARADLVLLDGNPLERIDALSTPQGVMARGRYLSRADLDRLLEDITASRGRSGVFVQIVMGEGIDAAEQHVADWRESGLALPPFQAISGTLLAYALASSGDLAGAGRLLRLVADVHPDDYFPVFMLGGLEQATGNVDAARAAYREVLVRRPGHAEAAWRIERLEGRGAH